MKVALNERANIKFLNGKGNENHELGTYFVVHKGIISTVKRIVFVSDGMSYTFKRSLV
jgi:hypothetical protein